MSPVLYLLQFTHSRKTAFAIGCFDLTTEFQPGMLNLPSFFLPFGLIVEDFAASRALVSSAYNFFQMFLICTINLLAVPNLCGHLQLIM